MYTINVNIPVDDRTIFILCEMLRFGKCSDLAWARKVADDVQRQFDTYVIAKQNEST